jgi:hypothetical protein
MMFLISGTYEGNFLRCNGRLKLPSDLSFFDLRNYQGAIPQGREINLIIQKIEFGTTASSTSHLLVSLCVRARDKVGRNGFFACRSLSPPISQILNGHWFSENVSQLYHYLRNDAPLADGAITHVPDARSSEIIDFSNLQSKVNSKRIARVNVNWLTEQGFYQIRELINERLIALDSFTLICGNDISFNDDIVDKIYDWHEESRLEALENRRKLIDVKRRQLALKNKQIEEERYWQFLYQLAEVGCIAAMALLGFIYFVFTMLSDSHQLDGTDPVHYFSAIAIVVAFGRLFFILKANLEG